MQKKIQFKFKSLAACLDQDWACFHVTPLVTMTYNYHLPTLTPSPPEVFVTKFLSFNNFNACFITLKFGQPTFVMKCMHTKPPPSSKKHLKQAMIKLQEMAVFNSSYGSFVA